MGREPARPVGERGPERLGPRGTGFHQRRAKPVNCNQRHHLGQPQIGFEMIPLCRWGKLLQQVESPLEMANGLVVRGSSRTALAGPPPRLNSRFGQAGLGVVPGQQLGLALHEG
jgi:hypothetical protein